VYVAPRGGGDATRISGTGFAAVPSWSPDMKWLAFVRAEAAGSRVWNLWLRNLSSETLHKHTSFRAGQVWGASWFHDSRRLCYSHETQLIISDLSTGMSQTFVTPRRGRLIRTPAVSPDGRFIVFQVYREGVWLLEVKTGAMKRILEDTSAEEFAWDPTGRRIAYHSARDGQWRIWVTTLR
jgi:Tol biopolymer transport system component